MLSRLFNGTREQRDISYQQWWGADAGEWGGSTLTGVNVTQMDALKIDAVLACISLVGDSIATLPVDAFVHVGSERELFRPKPSWIDHPDTSVSRIDYLYQLIVSLMLDGNSFTRILYDDFGVAGLSVLNPQKVVIERDPVNRRPAFRYDNGPLIDGSEIIHLRDIVLPGEMRGRSRVDELKQNLGISKALEQFAARFFGQGVNASGIIETPATPTKEQAKDMVDGFEKHHKGLRNAHRPGLLTGGATWKDTMVQNDSAQFLESRKFAIEGVARMFRCQPSMLGITSPGTVAYNSVEMAGIHHVVYTLRPYIERIELGHQRLFTNRDAFLKINVGGLMRGDQAARYSSYSTGIQAGFLNIDDIHRLEDMPPVTGGDVYRVPLTNIDVAAASLAELDRKSMIAQRFILAGFEPAAVLSTLELPAMTHTGLPSTQLQPVVQVNPDDPASVYKA